MKRHLPRNQQKKLEDDARLLRAWRAWHAEQLVDALAGAHGATIAQLVTVLDKLELDSAGTLLDFIRRSDLSSVDYDTRLTVLHQINAAITKLRERHGLTPFDDGVPGDRDNVYRRIQQMLFAAPPGAHPGPQTTQQQNDQTVKQHE